MSVLITTVCLYPNIGNFSFFFPKSIVAMALADFLVI